MKAPDDLLYEYAVIRFVPRIDREEFVNIGLLMLNKRNKWLKARIKIDEARIKALFPQTDMECLKKQSRLFEMKDLPARDLPVEEKYRWLASVKSACIQVSPSHPGIIFTADTPTSTDDTYRELELDTLKSGKETTALMEEEFSRLFQMLVE